MSMMEDFKKEFSSVTISASADSDVEGGKHILDITKLIEEYGLSDTDVTFDYSQMEEAEIRERLAALKEAGQEVGQPEPPASGRPDGVGNNFSLTAEQFRSELRNAIGQEKYVPKWACCCEEYPRYTLEDYDTESCQAIVYDCKLYQICGLTYLVDKDSVTVDFKSRVRKKIVYADFEDGSAALISIEPDSLFSNVMAETERIVADKDKTIKSLSEFKEKTEHEKLENAVQDIFSKFNELSDDAKFNELIENHSGMTAEEVEEKCFALLGRKKCSDVKNFSEQSERSIVTPPFAYDGDHGAQADEPYGGLYAKHGKKPI